MSKAKPADLPTGHVVGGRYEIRGLLGRGGFGSVYLAVHQQLGKEVALKMLLPELATDAEVVQRFIREARSAASIGHPGIVEVFDLGQDDDGIFLAMEKLEGE
jgi:eukaryotic-like serine/threonine-protein kinase